MNQYQHVKEMKVEETSLSYHNSTELENRFYYDDIEGVVEILKKTNRYSERTIRDPVKKKEYAVFIQAIRMRKTEMLEAVLKEEEGFLIALLYGYFDTNKQMTIWIHGQIKYTLMKYLRKSVFARRLDIIEIIVSHCKKNEILAIDYHEHNDKHNGKSALWHACNLGYTEIANFLIKNGADTYHMHDCCPGPFLAPWSPLREAISRGRYEIVDCILTEFNCAFNSPRWEEYCEVAPQIDGLRSKLCPLVDRLLTAKILFGHSMQIHLQTINKFFHYDTDPKLFVIILEECCLKFTDHTFDTRNDIGEYYKNRLIALTDFDLWHIIIDAPYYCRRNRIEITKCLIKARESPASSFYKWIFPVDLFKVVLEMCFLFVLPGEWKTK